MNFDYMVEKECYKMKKDDDKSLAIFSLDFPISILYIIQKQRYVSSYKYCNESYKNQTNNVENKK